MKQLIIADVIIAFFTLLMLFVLLSRCSTTAISNTRTTEEIIRTAEEIRLLKLRQELKELKEKHE